MRTEKVEALTKKAYSDARHEWNRLGKRSNSLEFNTTMLYLDRFLPKKGRILDVGGGPGRYSMNLADEGYRMTLFDLSDKHIEFARKMAKRKKLLERFDGFEIGSMLDMSRFYTNSFDAVLCLGGPLSHLGNESDRVRALSEITRVAKPGTPIFVSVMSKWGTLARPPDSVSSFAEEVNGTKHINNIAFRGEDDQWIGRYYSHYYTLDEALGLFSKMKGLRVLKTVGLQGLSSSWSERYINRFGKYSKAWKNWVHIHERLCETPAIIEISRHFLIIAKKEKSQERRRE
jgi:ubiquinone/menaquinone biosynthesis C-methylase UbiE